MDSEACQAALSAPATQMRWGDREPNDRPGSTRLRCVWPGEPRFCSSGHCHVPYYRNMKWRNDDSFRGYSCDAYPGCSNFTAHGGVWHGSSKLCSCAGDVLLKIAVRGRECDLADQHRALYLMRNDPCYEKLADDTDAPPYPYGLNGSDTVLARRILRVRLVAGGQSACMGKRCIGCTLDQEQLARFRAPGVCSKVRHILQAGEAKLLGHDSWPANFILPPEHVASGANTFSPYSGCPIVVIDLTQFIWDSVYAGDNRTGPGSQPPLTLHQRAQRALKQDMQPSALRPMPRWFDSVTPSKQIARRSLNWWPNCHVLQRFLPCEIAAASCATPTRQCTYALNNSLM